MKVRISGYDGAYDLILNVIKGKKKTRSYSYYSFFFK